MRIHGVIVFVAFGLSCAASAALLAAQGPAQASSPATESVPANPQVRATEGAGSGDQTKAEPHSEAKSETTKSNAAGRSVHTRRRAKRPAATVDAPHKIVVREGGVDEPATQIVTNLAPAEASRQRQNTEQLLNSTCEILKRLGTRPLDAEKQDTVSQVRNYVDEARAALKEGDISRASTLASKANLLADDLEKTLNRR